MELTVLRGARHIGGSVVKVSQDDSQILLDCGALLPEAGEEPRPDDFDLSVAGPLDAVFLTHHHGDHSGLVEKLPAGVPVYASAGTEAVLSAVADFVGKPQRKFLPLADGRPVAVGALRVAPLAVAHSASDAMMLLAEGGGKRLLYTGDYKYPPPELAARLGNGVDLLLSEGTLLTRGSQRYPDEAAVEKAAADVLSRHQGYVFVLQSAAHIGRIRSVVRACRSVSPGRRILQDMFQRYVLDQLGETELAQPYAFAAFGYRAETNPAAYAVFQRYLQQGVAASGGSIARNPGAMVFIRGSMLGLLKKAGLDWTDSALIYSFWHGYEQDGKIAALLRFLEGRGAVRYDIHTSGHGDQVAIRAMIVAAQPKRAACIHSGDADRFGGLCDCEVLTLQDGQTVAV